MFGKEPIIGRSSASLQFFSLLSIIFLSILFSNLFGMALAFPIWGVDLVTQLGKTMDYSDFSTIALLKYMQFINQLGLFIFPPILFAFLVHRKVLYYLGLKQSINPVQLLYGILLIFISVPFIGWLGLFNEKLVLPEFLSGVESWMKQKETEAMNLIFVFLDVKTMGGMIFNALLIAIIPAIGEEFLFRGVLIRLFKKWSGKIHLAVVLSAVLFSAMHMQFYGFLPRFVLGLILGYTFVWSGSLWLPIILHFVNNVSVVILYYSTNSKDVLTGNHDLLISSNNILGIIVSLIISVGLLYFIYKNRDKEFIA
jgi:membrane protease YdiL (CAAX protease family)